MNLEQPNSPMSLNKAFSAYFRVLLTR